MKTKFCKIVQSICFSLLSFKNSFNKLLVSNRTPAMIEIIALIKCFVFNIALIPNPKTKPKLTNIKIVVITSATLFFFFTWIANISNAIAPPSNNPPTRANMLNGAS